MSQLLQQLIQLLQELDYYIVIYCFILIFVAILFYLLGKTRMKTKILIPKSLKDKVEQYKGKRHQSEARKIQLQKSINSCRNYRWLIDPIIISSIVAVYFYNLMEFYYLEIQILGCFIFMSLFETYILIQKMRLEKVKSSLELTQKEIILIGKQIQEDLGEQLMSILKTQVFLQEIEKLKESQKEATESFKKQMEQEYKIKERNYEKEIKLLREREIVQKNELKRSIAQHNTAPPNLNNNNQNERLQKKIIGLKQERQIQRDFISQIVKFEWCQQCANIESEDECLKKYFNYSAKIGSEYQQGMDELKKWKLENKVKKQ